MSFSFSPTLSLSFSLSPSLLLMCEVLQFTGKDDYTPGDVGLEAAQRTEEVLRAQQQADEEEEEDTGVEEAKEEETESKMQVWR